MNIKYVHTYMGQKWYQQTKRNKKHKINDDKNWSIKPLKTILVQQIKANELF